MLRCHCTIYVYDNRDYIWHVRKPEKLKVRPSELMIKFKVFYSDKGKAFQIDTPDEWNIRIFSNLDFEIHRPSKEDVSSIQTDKRIEMISRPDGPPVFEM